MFYIKFKFKFICFHHIIQNAMWHHNNMRCGCHCKRTLWAYGTYKAMYIFYSLQVLRVETTVEDDIHWLHSIRGYLEEEVNTPAIQFPKNATFLWLGQTYKFFQTLKCLDLYCICLEKIAFLKRNCQVYFCAKPNVLLVIYTTL